MFKSRSMSYSQYPSLFRLSVLRECIKFQRIRKYTYSIFIKRARQIHGNKFDYSHVVPNDIQGNNSRIRIICNTCNYTWTQRIVKHISGKQGCPGCRKSHGEIVCSEFFDARNIPYIREYIIDNLPKKRFDFKFTYSERNYLLEFDGIQHFKYGYFHKSEAHFAERQQTDILKTLKAIEAKYYIIRIDYTQINNIGIHITHALSSQNQTYFSDPLMYQYITNILE